MLRGSFSANSTTENWKTQIRLGQNRSESRFTFPTCSGTPSVCRAPRTSTSGGATMVRSCR